MPRVRTPKIAGWVWGVVSVAITFAACFVAYVGQLTHQSIFNELFISSLTTTGAIVSLCLLALLRKTIDTKRPRARQRHEIEPLSLLYVSIASAAFVSAISFVTSSGMNALSISLERYLLFFAFLSTAIPFYHGALAYLQRIAADQAQRIMGDFLLLLAESFVLLLMSASYASPSYFVVLLLGLFILDTFWVFHALKDGRQDTPPAVWLYLSLIMIVYVGAAPILGVSLGSLEFLLGLTLVSLGRSTVDYIVAWSVYFYETDSQDDNGE